ncbi:MAG: DUF1292 domain-containing protein [Clostridia bacterium]|nr:DUF1292 domain-containing protein [Clostridia bacterium]
MENENLNPERDLIEITYEDGTTHTQEIIDYFFYNGQEYAIVSDYDEEDEAEGFEGTVDCYIMRVNSVTDENGEELDEFEPIEDPALEERLLAVASQRLSDEEEADEE